MPSIPNVPKDWELDYLAWQVAGGRPTEIDYVYDSLCYADCIRILMMRRYDNFAQRMVLKSKNG